MLMLEMSHIFDFSVRCVAFYKKVSVHSVDSKCSFRLEPVQKNGGT